MLVQKSVAFQSSRGGPQGDRRGRDSHQVCPVLICLPYNEEGVHLVLLPGDQLREFVDGIGDGSRGLALGSRTEIPLHSRELERHIFPEAVPAFRVPRPLVGGVELALGLPRI